MVYIPMFSASVGASNMGSQDGEKTIKQPQNNKTTTKMTTKKLRMTMKRLKITTETQNKHKEAQNNYKKTHNGHKETQMTAKRQKLHRDSKWPQIVSKQPHRESESAPNRQVKETHSLLMCWLCCELSFSENWKGGVWSMCTESRMWTCDC